MSAGSGLISERSPGLRCGGSAGPQLQAAWVGGRGVRVPKGFKASGLRVFPSSKVSGAVSLRTWGLRLCGF